MKPILFFMLALSVAILSGCADDNGSDAAKKVEGTMQIDNKTDAWTYVSLTQNRVVGTCALGDTVSERQWAQRSDWDIAVCGGMIRTNSGTSGSGNGGITSTSAPYESVDVAPETDYHVDTDTLKIW